MRYVVSMFIILAPLIDYTYSFRFPLGKVFELSPNRIIKLLPILIVFLFVVLRPKRSFFWKYGLMLIYFTLLSTIIGFYHFPGNVLDSYLRFISSFIFIFIAGKNLNEDDIVFIGKALIFVTLVPIFISYLQLFGFVPYTDYDMIAGLEIGRVSGGYEKQVAMMSYLIIGFSIALFFFVHTENVYHKILYVVYIALAMGVVILSTHRASMVIFFLVLIYFFYRYDKKYLLAIPLILALVVIRYFDFLREVFIISAGFEKGDWAFILRGKLGFWYDYMSTLISAGPLSIIFGKGHSVLDVRNTSFLPYLFSEPHSDYVRIMYQYGVIGFSLFVSVLIIILKKSFEFYRDIRNINEKLIGDLGIIIGVSLLLYSITIEPTRYPSFWWFYAIIASFILVKRGQFDGSCVSNESLSPLKL